MPLIKKNKIIKQQLFYLGVPPQEKCGVGLYTANEVH
jgi:hypothetical protein